MRTAGTTPAARARTTPSADVVDAVRKALANPRRTRR